MLKDILVVDDVFSNPQSIIDSANSMQFYSASQHPDLSEHRQAWDGVRTKAIYDQNSELFMQMMNEILMKIVSTTSAFSTEDLLFNYNAQAFFHRLSESDKFKDSWFHRDNYVLCAGVVYLNQCPVNNSGTIIEANDEKRIVENKFNRLVVYNSDYLHAPEQGFGTDQDSRLTFTFFLTMFQFMKTYQ